MADDSDPYASLLAQPAPASPTAPEQPPDPYASLIGKPTADPGASVSGYVAAGGRSTWGDVIQGAVAGGHDVAADAAGALAAVQEPGGPRTSTQAFALSQQQAARQAEQGMTPAAQAPGFFSHPLVSTAEALPGIAAIAAPAALAGPAAPVVVGGLMGAQTLGAAQNRAAEQGIELTPAQKAEQFGIGAVSGVAPEFGIPAKIATNALVKGVLEGGVGATTFGVTAAGGEAASQQTEIAAGKRQGYDIPAIVGAGKSGAEQGFGVSVLGAGRHDASERPSEDAPPENEPVKQLPLEGTGRDGTQTGGAAHIARKTPAKRAEEANKRDVGGTTTSAGGTGPARPADKVDVDQALAAEGKPITPVGKPQAEPVEQPTVAQPETAQPSQTATEAPRTPEAAQGPPPPQPPPSDQPAPQPPPAAQPPDPAVLAQQHAELLDPTHPRDAMIYPKGAQHIDITENKGKYGRVKLPGDGGTVVYDHDYGRGQWTKDAIKAAAKDGSLQGKIEDQASKAPVVEAPAAAAKEAATAPPAAAAEGPPSEVVHEPTVQPEGASQAREQAPPVTPESKAPPPPAEEKLGENKFGMSVWRKGDGTFVKRYPDGREEGITPTVADLLTKQGAWKPAETSEADKIRAAAQAEAERLKPQGRVYRSETPEEKVAQAKQAEAQARAAATEAAKPVTRQTKEPEQQQPGKKGEPEKEAMRASNATADEVVRNNLPQAGDEHAPDPARGSNGKGARAQVKARVEKMVKEAIAGKFKFMDKLRDRKDPELAHSASAILLHEAKRLADLKVAKTSDYRRFLDRERELLKGEAAKADVLKDRRAEGKEFAAARGEGVKEIATEGVETGETQGIEHVEKPDVAEEYEKAKERVEEEKVAQEPGEERKETPLQRQAREASERARAKLAAQERGERERPVTRESEEYAAPTTVAGFKRVGEVKVEKRRTIPGIKKQELPEIEVRSETGKMEKVSPISSVTGKEAVEAHFKPDRYSAALRPMMERLRDAVLKFAGDTEVHYISHDDMMRLFGAARGVYDGKRIYLNADRLNHDTALHEAFHDATSKAILNNLPLWRMMQRLRDEVENRLPSLTAKEREIIQPALDGPEEFLTYLMTSDKVQDILKGIKISDELARDIGIPKWRKATMWNGMLHIIQRALGLEPRDVSAIEAAMALTEHTMWSRDPGMAMEAAGRLAQHQMQEMRPRFQRIEPPERDQETFLRSPSETLKSARGITRDVATQFAKDKLTNLSDKLLHGSMKVFSGTWLNDMHGHLFEDGRGKILDAINQARNKVSSTYHSLMDSDKDIITRGLLLDRMFASHMPDYARLVNLSNTHNIHADRAAPTIPKNPEDAARKNWQGNKFYGEARTIYEHLPKELQQRYTAEKKFYMDKQAQSAKAIINKVMPLFDPPKGSTLADVMERARNNDLTDDDWKHYGDLNVDGSLRKAMRLMNRKDVYFNSQREGRYVVTGRYEMPTGGADTAYSGELLPDNKREFDSEKEAHDYVTGTRMHAVTHEVHYWTDKKSGETKRVPSDFATSDPGTESIKYQVRLERDNTQMATSKAEAKRNRQAMEADGVKELSEPLDKRDEKAWSSINTADQKAIERKIDSNDDMTNAERQNLKEITRQLMLAGQGDMGAHMIQARKVAGARYDNGLGLQSYARAANFHLAREQHADEINEGMNRLETHARAHQTDADATRRSIVANEYRNRVYGRDADTLNSKTHPLFQKMMTWAFVNFLMRPSHVLLSQIHPYVYSVPMMGARHGYWKALQGQRQAMSDLGGTMHNLWEGAKAGADVYKSGKERDIDRAVQMAHGVDPIRVMISRLKNAEERDFLTQMWQTQHLHSAFDASVFSGDGLDRANAVIRQFTDAMEANNRLSTALNAYRLEKNMHGDKLGALAYSRRVIEETHGVFSSTNTAPLLKNPIIRGAMQFRQQPMNLATMMYRNIGKAATGDTEAKWTLAYQLGTAALLGGMGGMPLDLPKLAGLASQAAGGPSPADYADKLHRLLADNLGETGANGIEEGLPGLMGPLGPSVGHRSGYDAGFFFGEPHSDNVNDIYSYAAQMAAGAPGGMAAEWLTALHDAEQGNWERVGEGVLPGSFKDFLKSYRLATEGTMTGKQQVREASYGDAILQALGFSGVERQQALAGHYALQKATQEQKQTVADQLKAKHVSHEKSVLGVKIPKKERALGEEYEGAYGQ